MIYATFHVTKERCPLDPKVPSPPLKIYPGAAPNYI